MICKIEHDFIGHILGQEHTHPCSKLTQGIFKKYRCVNDFVSPIKRNSAELLLQNLQKRKLQLHLVIEQETEEVKFKRNDFGE